MSKRHTNPYKEGSAYGKVFEAIRKAKGQTVSRKELLEAGHAPADVTVVLSPRDESQCKGDCRGNMSSQGHVYYLKVMGQGRDKRFRLCWRKTELNPHRRPVKADKVQAQKVQTKTKAKAKSRGKAKAAA